MENKPKTITEALNRLRGGGGPDIQHWRDLADALEILVILGGNTDSRDMDRDVTDFGQKPPMEQPVNLCSPQAL
jgi:hypothetical protein